jgi:transposase-like protein
MGAPLDPEVRARIVSELMSGKTVIRTASDIGVSATTVQRVAKEIGPRPNRRKSTLEAKRKEIERCIRMGRTITDVCRTLRVDRKTVAMVARQESAAEV